MSITLFAPGFERITQVIMLYVGYIMSRANVVQRDWWEKNLELGSEDSIKQQIAKYSLGSEVAR